jgi:hypothetical protein
MLLLRYKLDVRRRNGDFTAKRVSMVDLLVL